MRGVARRRHWLQGGFLVPALFAFLTIGLSPCVAEPAEESELVLLQRAPQLIEQRLARARQVLRQTPQSVKQLDDLQFAAIELARKARDPDASSDLVRLVLIEHVVEPVAASRVGIGPVEPSDLRPDALPRLDLSRYPAARALAAVGVPAARVIMTDIHESRGEIPARRLEVYAEILAQVYGSHTVVVLTEERSCATRSKAVVFDRLLATSAVRSTAVKFFHRSHE